MTPEQIFDMLPREERDCQKRIEAVTRRLTEEKATLTRERDEANEALGRTVTVTVGTSCLTRDLVWCGGCGRGISRSGNWYHCPQCGGKIDQESYRAAREESERNGGNIARYVSGEGADQIKALEAELSDLRTRLEVAEQDAKRFAGILDLAVKAPFQRIELAFDIDEGGLWGLTIPDVGAVTEYTNMDPRCIIDAAISQTTQPEEKP